MLQATAVKPTEVKTCSTCPHFNNFHEPNGRGWCNLFDQPARTHHIQSLDCVLNLNTSEFTEAFPTQVIELDREGYPMDNETVENAYFSNDFVTYPNEPF